MAPQSFSGLGFDICPRLRISLTLFPISFGSVTADVEDDNMVLVTTCGACSTDSLAGTTLSMHKDDAVCRVSNQLSDRIDVTCA